MHHSAEAGKSIQKAIDWAVFSLGALALATAIGATVMGSADDQLARTSVAPPETSAS